MLSEAYIYVWWEWDTIIESVLILHLDTVDLFDMPDTILIQIVIPSMHLNVIAVNWFHYKSS